jgi:hypothetical protein
MEEVKKQGIESLFVPYQIALDMKSIGFDEPCFGYYNGQGNYIGEEGKMNSNCNKLGMYDAYCTVPLYQQAFKWFRENHNIYNIILPSYADNKEVKDRFFYELAIGKKLKQELEYHNTYEEAELACLKKLIEIAHPNK